MHSIDYRLITIRIWEKYHEEIADWDLEATINFVGAWLWNEWEHCTQTEPVCS